MATSKSAKSTKAAKPAPFATEADLCALFIQEFNELEGWTCYPEAAGFDILAVHDDGRQIGVQAKLQLNAKVADQILPTDREDYYGAAGPDHRIVIVGRITEANEGIARMLDMLGVKVLNPRHIKTKAESRYTFESFKDLRGARTKKSALNQPNLFDWNPAKRCIVPSIAEDAPAGVPCPVRLTPWKESAIKVMVKLRKQGFITTKDIAAHGISASTWIRPKGRKQPWLKKGLVRGQWVETPYMPALDQQHPALFAREMGKA